MPEKAGYIEDYVCCSIDVYFTLLGTHFTEFSLEPISRPKEKTKGFDAFLDADHIFPFYMQFKTPKMYMRKSNSQIIRERKIAKASLARGNENGPLFFNIIKHQHEALHALLENGENVAYICPLSINKTEYRERLVNMFQNENSYKKHSKRAPLYSKMSHYTSSIVSGHVSIFPKNEFPTNLFIREQLQKSNFQKYKFRSTQYGYSFLKDGTEVVFHPSEKKNIHVRAHAPLRDRGKISLFRPTKKIAEKITHFHPILFEEWLSSMCKNLKSKDKNKKFITRDNANEKLTQLISSLNESIKKNTELEHSIFSFPQKKEGLEAWLWFGDELERKCGIYQYGFCFPNKS